MGQVLMSQIRNHCRKIIRCGDAPHCIITPHVSGGYALPETLEKILELSIENLERYEKGETLHNIIDFSTGYVKR